jgi:Ca2+-binding RTX toxin-like protein
VPHLKGFHVNIGLYRRVGALVAVIAALIGVGLALTTTVFAVDGSAPSVTIISPEDGASGGPGIYPVIVSFSANADSDNAVTIILKGNGHEIARHENPVDVKEGTHTFEIDTALYSTGEKEIQAFAYQGDENGEDVGESNIVTVFLLSSGPGITPHVNPAPNANGWNNTDVTVSFETNLPPAEIASLTDPVLVTGETDGLEVEGTVVDTGGESASAAALVKLDRTPPSVQIMLPGDGAPVVAPAAPVMGTVSDALSGIDSITCNGAPATVADSQFLCSAPVGPGPGEIVVHVEDKAGNASQASVSVIAFATVDDAPKLRCHGLIPTLIGTMGDDLIIGTEGSDVIVGLDGNDILIGLGGQDFICGGPGNDVISGGRGNDRLHGEDGNDSIAGQDGDDELVGDGGEDLLAGGSGKDDIMCGPDFDAVDGGSGEDQVTPDCEIIMDSASSGTGVDEDLLCTDVDATLTGTDGDDVLIGTSGMDVILGLGGDDTIVGLEERDRLCGGLGDDVLVGGVERDHLNGAQGNDVIVGGQGQDHLLGERGNDLLYGGQDDDHIKCGGGTDFANAGLGTDTTDGTCETVINLP